jgi:nitroreductase
MDFFKVIESRHSYRSAYTDAGVPESDLIKILDAGIRAPSGCNAQTTSFIMVTNPELRSQIAKILTAQPISTAPALIIVTTEKVTFDFGLDFELEDYGAAVENILLAATALGYASCWYDGMTRLGGVDEALAKLLGVSPDKQVRSILPIGVPANQGAQAGRKPFNDRVDWRR